MERRKFIIGAGALATGSAAAMGTGAFSSVEAERTIDMSTADDSAALLTIDLNEDYGGDGEDYVAETDDGLFEINVDNLNGEAVTVFEDLYTVHNTGGQDLVLFISNDFGEKPWRVDDPDPIYGSGTGNDGPVDIKYNGQSIVGGNSYQTEVTPSLDAGESVDLTVEVDTRGIEDDDELDGKYQFNAEEPPE